MEYLMKEEIKSTRSADYYNVAQSDKSFSKRRVNNLKNGVGIAKKQSRRHRDQIPLCGLY
jgi:hypothetical protein